MEFHVAGCSHSLTCHQPYDIIQPVLRVWSHLPDQESLHILSRQFIKWPLHIHIWLVVSIPLKILINGKDCPIYYGKNVWNHQPDIVYIYIYITNMFYMYIPIAIDITLKWLGFKRFFSLFIATFPSKIFRDSYFIDLWINRYIIIIPIYIYTYVWHFYAYIVHTYKYIYYNIDNMEHNLK